MITREFKLYLNAGVGVAPVINANQFDQDEEWIFTLLQSDGTVYTPSTGAIIGLKQDGTTILNAGTVNSSGQVVITETEQMTAVPGSNLFEILIDGNTHGTANFVVFVERRPGDIDNPSESDISLFQEAIEAAGNVTQFQADISALQSGLATTNANLTSEANTRASADATLQSNISAEASTRQTQDAVLQAEIDQLIAPTGEAPSAAEVQNARIGVDGTTYDTLGNAIRGQVGDLKNALTQVQDVLGIDEEIKATANVDGATVIINPIDFHIGDTITWTISSAISAPVYCYVYDNQGERLTSRTISAGQTSASVTLTESAENGYISALCNTSVNVTVEVTLAIQPENRIDEIENSITLLSESISDISNESVVSGYDLKSESGVETGAGAYYWSGGRPYLNTSGSYGTDYTYFIFPVNKNSVYSVSVTPRWLILVDENGGKVTEDVTGKMIQTGNAVKLYITISNAYVSSFAISEGYLANKVIKKALSIETQTESHHGNSMAMDTMYFTVGMPETLHYNNILALPSDKLECITSCDGQDSHDEKGISITPVRTFSNTGNAVRMLQYDNDLNLIYQPDNTGLVIKALSLQDCSALVIGDSTVGSWGLMTEQMLNVFDENNKILTLLGTQHSGNTDARNMHEGRGGWSAKIYCTEATHGNYTNPFLNNGHFDFSYYMQQQEYSAPDFVVIQLGINDVSNISMSEFKTVSEQALMYEKEMIDSILAYNSNIKVLINPPTTPTSDQSKLSMYYETTIFRNLVIRYAMMLRRLATQYSSNKVRCSNNNLILDSSTDIRDSVHPTDDGFVKLGNEVVNQFNCWF